MSDNTVVLPKVDSDRLMRELLGVLVRLRTGLLTQEQAKQELGVLSALQRTYETKVLEERIDRIEMLLEAKG